MSRYAVLLSLLLAACGQSGDLYLPPKEPPAEPAPQPAPEEQKEKP